MNLESLYEQMKADTTKKMASILDMTDSAYYPCFRSMFRNVVAALNEARDITLYLKPLATHFEVNKKGQYDFGAAVKSIGNFVDTFCNSTSY